MGVPVLAGAPVSEKEGSVTMVKIDLTQLIGMRTEPRYIESTAAGMEAETVMPTRRPR